MIKELTVENFRCFKSVRLDNLSRINVVVGPNGSGKTALLEAVFLHIGSGGQFVFVIRQHRGLPGEVSPQTDIRHFTAFWNDLFYHFDENAVISIRSWDTHRGDRSLDIAYQASSSMLIPANGSPLDAAPVAPLNFIFRVQDRPEQNVRIEFTPKGFRVGFIKDTIPGAYISTGHTFGAEAAEHFSVLSKSNRSDEIVEALRREYPQVESISVEVLHGVPTLFAFVPSIPEAKVPMELVSAGVNKYLNLLMSIALNSGGVVLVDEIENGFYYAQLPAICEGLRRFCDKFDTQLFVSTHSNEFLAALTSAGESDFCLIRSEKTNGSCHLSRFNGSDTKAALEQLVEVR